jgi:cysteine-rich repeat protein
VWTSFGDHDGSLEGIFGQRFSSDGGRLGTEFQVNTYTTGSQVVPAVATDAAGNFVVVWTSYDGYFTGISGQRFASDGSRIGTEFQVNAYTSGTQDNAAVAESADGNFVVVWQSVGPGDQDGIFAQRFTSAGALDGTEFLVNTYTTHAQNRPSVTTDDEGDFVIAWSSQAQVGNNRGVFAQRYDSDGARHGGEFQVNTVTTGRWGNYGVRVASDADGDFVVAFSGPDADISGVFARRYQDPCGDGVLGPGEQCDVGDRRPGNCCSPTCQLVPADCAACEACDVTAGCVVRPRGDCRHPAKPRAARLELASRTTKRSTLLFDWLRGAATTVGDFGDPRTAPDYTLCLFDRAGGTDRLAFRGKAPAGAAWKAGRKGFRYRSPGATPDGLTSVTLQSGKAGKAATLVRGKGANLRLGGVDFTPPVTAQLQAGGGAGACFAGTFSRATKHSPTQFKATGN